jgi:hypothetical protein
MSIDKQVQGEDFNLESGYCERLAGDYGHLLGEPFNTITNLAFIIAAFYAIRMLSGNNQIKLRYLDMIILAVTIGVIGLGSTVFHAIPSKLTMLMDVLPITLYIHLYIFSFFKRVIGLHGIISLTIVIAFVGLGIFTGKIFDPSTLNGTIMYIPTYGMLLVLALICQLSERKEFAKYIFVTALIWTFSLTARTLDFASCDYTFGIGTHIFWHILNAIVLYRMLVVLSRNEVSKS